MKCPGLTVPPASSFSKSWNFSALKKLLMLRWVCVYLRFAFIWEFSFRTLCSGFIVSLVAEHLASSLLSFLHGFFPFPALLCHLFHVVCVSIFKLRAGISRFFLIKILFIFFPLFFLSWLLPMCFSCSLIPATITENFSM